MLHNPVSNKIDFFTFLLSKTHSNSHCCSSTIVKIWPMKHFFVFFSKFNLHCSIELRNITCCIYSENTQYLSWMSIFCSKIQDASAYHSWHVPSEYLFQCFRLLLLLLLLIQGFKTRNLGNLQSHILTGAQQIAHFLVPRILTKPPYKKLYKLTMVTLSWLSLWPVLLLMSSTLRAAIAFSNHIELLQSRINQDLPIILSLFLMILHIIL